MILVVDDDFLFLVAVDRVLGGLTIPAANLLEGLRIARTEQPDAILLDVRFGGHTRTGIDAIQAFRRAAKLASIVIISADYRREDAITALANGCYGYLEKVDPAQIRTVVEQAVSASRANAATGRRPPIAHARASRARHGGYH